MYGRTIALHEVSDGPIHLSLAGELGFSLELAGRNRQLEVPRLSGSNLDGSAGEGAGKGFFNVAAGALGGERS